MQKLFLFGLFVILGWWVVSKTPSLGEPLGGRKPVVQRIDVADIGQKVRNLKLAPVIRMPWV